MKNQFKTHPWHFLIQNRKAWARDLGRPKMKPNQILGPYRIKISVTLVNEFLGDFCYSNCMISEISILYWQDFNFCSGRNFFCKAILSYHKSSSSIRNNWRLSPCLKRISDFSCHKELPTWRGHLPPSSEISSAYVDAWPKGLTPPGGQWLETMIC